MPALASCKMRRKISNVYFLLWHCLLSPRSSIPHGAATIGGDAELQPLLPPGELPDEVLPLPHPVVAPAAHGGGGRQENRRVTFCLSLVALFPATFCCPPSFLVSEVMTLPLHYLTL